MLQSNFSKLHFATVTTECILFGVLLKNVQSSIGSIVFVVFTIVSFLNYLLKVAFFMKLINTN